MVKMKGESIDVEKRMNRDSPSMKENMRNDDCDVEAELTSLSWLQSLDITSASSLPTPPCSPSPPPVTRQPRKKLSPLIKAELGKPFSPFQSFFFIRLSILSIIKRMFRTRLNAELIILNDVELILYQLYYISF